MISFDSRITATAGDVLNIRVLKDSVILVIPLEEILPNYQEILKSCAIPPCGVSKG